MFMKLIGAILLGYSLYLNNIQTTTLTNSVNSVKSDKIKGQLKMNIICSYIFSLFLFILLLFVLKSFL
jgi:hypothetical protein